MINLSSIGRWFTQWISILSEIAIGIFSRVLLLAIGIALGLSGCATQARFDKAEYAAYSGWGDGALDGHAVLRWDNGRVATCAGETAMILPATEFTRQWLMSVASGHGMSRADIFRIAQVGAQRSALCDAKGNFHEPGLKPGRWLALVVVTWSAGPPPQRALLWGETEVRSGQTGSVLLTR